MWYDAKPIAYAKAYLKRSDDQLKQDMLAMTLSGKMPKIYRNHLPIENPTLADFKEYLTRSVAIKAEQAATWEANKIRKQQYAAEILEVKNLEAAIELAQINLAKKRALIPPAARNVLDMNL